MNKIIFVFLLFFSAKIFAIDKPAVDTFGVWGYQDVTSANLDSFKTYNIQGIHYLVQWRDIRPHPDSAYNWTALTNKIDTAIAHNIYCSFQVNVGQGSPSWIFDSCGSYMTVGVPQQPGPYPDYYNPKYTDYYNQLLRDIGNYLAGLSYARRHHVLFCQLCEGSTGDGQPYKGVLDSCQAPGFTCTAADSLANPALGNPFIPQDRFEFKWEQYRRAAWDTMAMSEGYQAVSNYIALMFNTGNSGNDLDFAISDSSDIYDDDNYVRGHFAWLPIKPWVKSGTLSHLYAFRGELSHFQRIKTPDRGEVQGPIKFTAHPHKELFALVCSALAGDLHMLNIDQSYMNMKQAGEVRTSAQMTDFFNLMTNTTKEGFSIPAFKVDYGDTANYPTAIYGALINPDPVQSYKFQRRLYAYSQQSGTYGSGDDFNEWQYWKAVDAFINPARVTAINALYPQAAFGNMRDSMWWNDHVTNAAYNYEKNLYQTNAATSIVPAYRVGPDTAIYGRFAGKPKLISNQCTWYYNVDEKIMRRQNADSLEVSIVYLDNNSGGSIAVSCLKCGSKIQYQPPVIINGNTGLWKTAIFKIPKFRFKENGYDFMIDFVGGANTTIGMVQVKVLQFIH